MTRPLVPEDLVRLRDIGPEDRSFPDARLITISPNRRYLAFQLRQAEPESNSYCLGMYVLEIRPGAFPKMIDKGGELIRATIDFRGKAGFPTGIPLTITPRWSPRGDWIGFLKRQDGTTQVWRANADGSGSWPITSEDFDVDDFRITPDGLALVFSGRPRLKAAQAQLSAEGLIGYHYDDRFSPSSRSTPFPAPPIEREMFWQDLATGRTRTASIAEAEAVGLSTASAQLATSASVTGRRAWFTSDGRIVAASLTLSGEDDSGREVRCQEPACAGRLSRLWWAADGKSVRYSRIEGPGLGTTAIYEWSPGGGSPRRLYSTEDVLDDCEPLGAQLVCVIEGSLMPRRIVLLDPVSGRRTDLFDPNPEFSRLQLGQVRRFNWKNKFGKETIGDLVLPTSYKRGHRYPLVIVQYDTRGFLRGGTGDEFPIQAFANRGFAVLSFSRPPPVGLSTSGSDAVAIDKANLSNFADRWNVQASLEAGVRLLVSSGIVDEARVGITGLSDGGSTVEFSLLHSTMVAAAAMSSCCWDPSLLMRVGPNAARDFIAEGYPRLIDDGTIFWKQISLAANAERVNVPILLQMSDDEYLSSLTGYSALREVGKPIDLFVFPGEHHVKWQPTHKLAVYQRALDWFDYWLRGARSGSAERAKEIDHWDQLALGASSRGSALDHEGGGPLVQ